VVCASTASGRETNKASPNTARRIIFNINKDLNDSRDTRQTGGRRLVLSERRAV
jgi:hypothetical protein